MWAVNVPASSRLCTGLLLLAAAACTSPANPAATDEAKTSPADPPPASHPGSQPGSQPGSGPASASSLPSDHSTSSVAVDLESLFRMPDVRGGTVMTVGPERLGKRDLEQALRTLQLELGAAGAPENLTRFEVLRAAVDRMAETARRKLLAEELDVKLDQTQVKAWLSDLEARMKANPSFKVFLLRAGKDADARRRDAEQTILWRQVQDRVVKQVLEESEALARAYYDKNKAQFTEREGVETWRILIKAPRGMVQRDRDVAKARAQKLYERVKKSPDTFAHVAEQFSDGGKGPHGGFIGWLARGTLNKTLEDQIYNAKPNTILPVYDAPIGYYIYKVGRRRSERVKPFDSVKEEILRKVYPAKVAKRVDAHMKRLRDKYPAEPAIPELAALQKKEQARIDAVKAKLEAQQRRPR